MSSTISPTSKAKSVSTAALQAKFTSSEVPLQKASAAPSNPTKKKKNKPQLRIDISDSNLKKESKAERSYLGKIINDGDDLCDDTRFLQNTNYCKNFDSESQPLHPQNTDRQLQRPLINGLVDNNNFDDLYS